MISLDWVTLENRSALDHITINGTVAVGLQMGAGPGVTIPHISFNSFQTTVGYQIQQWISDDDFNLHRVIPVPLPFIFTGPFQVMGESVVFLDTIPQCQFTLQRTSCRPIEKPKVPQTNDPAIKLTVEPGQTQQATSAAAGA